jgi:exopolysaccharide production protein ExoZ
MQRQIIFNVQLLRFIAAASVLFTHTYTLLLSSPLLASVPWIGGVDIFFVISGFIMTWMTRGHFGSGSEAKRFLMRRIIRIVPPYWFFTLVVIAIVFAAGGRIRHTSANPAEIITSFLFIPWPGIDEAYAPILAQGWTLNYEMFFYLAFAVALLFRRGLLALVIAFAGLVGLHPYIPSSWFVLDYFSYPIILEFVAGIGIARLYLGGTRLPTPISVLLIGAAVLWYAAWAADAGAFTQALQLGVPASFLTAALVLAPEPKKVSVLRRLLRKGGDASYTLYLSHTLTVNAVVLGAMKVGVDAPWLVTATAMFVAIVFAVIFYDFVEAPLTRFLGRRVHARISDGPATVAP